MLCTAIKGLRHLLAGGRLCERVHFVAQASPARPLAAHLRQFAGWAQARAAHLRSLTIAHSHTTTSDPGYDPDYDPEDEFSWLCLCLVPDAIPALLGLLRALRGACQLAELRLEFEALPAGFDREDPTTTDLPASSELLDLPRLEILHLDFPALRLTGSLAHFCRLRTLTLKGVLLDPATRLPPSLTALQGHGAYYSAIESMAAICEMPRFGAPGLRSLAIRGGSYYCSTQPLLLRGLSQLIGLTSLSIDGPRLGREEGEEEGEEEEEEEGEQDGQQAAAALLEMAQLQALQRLSLLHVIGFAVEGQPLVLPHWPVLKELELCSVSNLTDLRVSGLPALQKLSVRDCPWLEALSLADLPALQELTVYNEYQHAEPTLTRISLSGLPSLGRLHASADALRLLPALPGVVRL